MYRTVFWTLWEKARVGCFERTASKHVYYLGWNRSPAQAGCMRQVPGPGALGRPRGIGWRGMWEGGSGWGIHVNPWLIHVNVWKKTLQYYKVISVQLIKISDKKNSEYWRIDAFELWCWTRLLRVPWIARRSHQWILKEINPEYSLEGLMLKFQYFRHLMQRADSLGKTMMLGKIEGRIRGWQRTRWLNGVIDSMDVSLSMFWKIVMDRETWHAAVCEVTKSWHDWTTMKWTPPSMLRLSINQKSRVKAYRYLKNQLITS